SGDEEQKPILPRNGTVCGRFGATEAERCAVTPGRQEPNDALSGKPERCVVGSQLALKTSCGAWMRGSRLTRTWKGVGQEMICWPLRVFVISPCWRRALSGTKPGGLTRINYRESAAKH